MADPIVFDLSHYLVELIPTALTAALVWGGKTVLGKQREMGEQLKSTIEELRKEVRELVESRHIHDTAKALLEQRLDVLEHELQRLISRCDRLHRSPSGQYPVVP